MKRCPECDSSFPDAEQFCELDGTVLVTDAPRPLPVDRTKSSPTLLPIAVLVGILLGVLLSVIYFATSRQTTQENSNTSSSSSSAQQRQVVQPLHPVPATANPSVEASVEPSASPSVETPSPQNSPTPLGLSSSDPISTGAKGNPVVIRLATGATIEADEAWQTGEGIWYRKHCIVTLLDPRTVKAVEKVSPAAPQPSAATSPSP